MHVRIPYLLPSFLFSVLLLVSTHPDSVSAQQTTGLMSSTDRMDIEVMHSQNLIPAGTESRIAVVLNLDEDWHVNANVPSSDFLIGTELTIEPVDGLTVSGYHYPEPVTYRFEFSEDPVDVYEGQSPIFSTLYVSEAMEPGRYDLNGSIRVQACNNEICLAPETVDLDIPVEITAAGTGFQPLNQELFEGVGYARSSITDVLSASGGGEIAALFDSLGWFWAFAGIFLVGLALNLTPCVYPMMSVTVSLFGSNQGQSSRFGYTFMMASVYVFGIVFMYSVLGVVAAYTGALFGSWLQSPWVLGGIGVLILALSLSMFGLYELQPPTSWLQSLSGTQRNTSGILGHFFSGLVVGVFAAPCIGPPIIALLAFVGAQGDPLFGFSIFFVMALGLGFPYLILGTFSGLLSRLPSSGVWMVWVKKVFGVVLVGVALFYLALALYPAWTLHVLIITLLAGGLYLGFLERSGRGQKVFTGIKWAVGLATMVIGFLLYQNLQKPGIEWESYTPERYEQAVTDGTPVLLDFYADWCIPCLELDRSTFTDPAVIEATSGFVRLKIDNTQYESEQASTLREQFDIAGVPTIVFIDSQGEEVPGARFVGYLPAERFLERVEMVQ